jgi:signal transduction histidine kinase
MLERGLRTMRLNSRMVLVGVLVFVFPLLFIWAAQNFYSTAYDNIHTALKQKVGIVTDSLTAVLVSTNADQPTLNNTLRVIMQENGNDSAGITTIRIYTDTPNGLLTIAADNDDLINQYEPTAESIKNFGFSNTNTFFQVESLIDGKRQWSTYKRVIVNNNFFYIYAQFDLSKIDATMTKRQQESYLGLSGIFIFLLALAYWLNRQIYWQKKYVGITETLRDRDLFSNMIAHEFRSPLTAIKGYASFLEESQTLQNDDRRFAANIRQSAEHLVALVSDFLEVARLQSGKLKIEKHDIDVRTILATTVENLAMVADEKGLELSYDPESRPVIFNTDGTRLLQVLTNLVTNSIKYTQSGTIKLSCETDYKSVIIKVMDTGMGISADDQQRLFAPFTRVGGVDAAKITGTGLGMYITKQLVSLLGGSVGVESIKGVGTHLVVTLKAD